MPELPGLRILLHEVQAQESGKPGLSLRSLEFKLPEHGYILYGIELSAVEEGDLSSQKMVHSMWHMV